MKVLKLIVLLVLLMQTRTHGQLRFDNGISLSAGSNAASGFGTNLFLGVRYNYFPAGGTFFVEGALGFGSLKSKVIESLTKSRVFDTERLLSYEFVGGYDPLPNSAMPFFVAGVAGLNQGGQSNFAGVLGLGKRVPLKGAFGSDRFGFRYDVRDQIFSQTINNTEYRGFWILPRGCLRHSPLKSEAQNDNPRILSGTFVSSYL